jgi:ketosteroid isomerase-like protein
MSQENVEVVRRTFDAYNRADLEGVLDHLAPDFEFHPSGRFMDTQAVYLGREGWIDFWNTFQAAWESITISIERIEDLGDRVLILGIFHGRDVEAVRRPASRLRGSGRSEMASSCTF